MWGTKNHFIIKQCWAFKGNGQDPISKNIMVLGSDKEKIYKEKIHKLGIGLWFPCSPPTLFDYLDLPLANNTASPPILVAIPNSYYLVPPPPLHS